MSHASRSIIVLDTSVLVNFLHIQRMDLIADHSCDFIVTDHVDAEITDHYPRQRMLFSQALQTGVIRQISVTDPAEVSLFGKFATSGRLGTGECSAIAVALHNGYMLAIDDRQAAAQAHRFDPKLPILGSQDVMVSMISENLLTVPEADAIKDQWAAHHRFRLKIRSFADIMP